MPYFVYAFDLDITSSHAWLFKIRRNEITGVAEDEANLRLYLHSNQGIVSTI